MAAALPPSCGAAGQRRAAMAGGPRAGPSPSAPHRLRLQNSARLNTQRRPFTKIMKKTGNPTDAVRVKYAQIGRGGTMPPRVRGFAAVPQ